MPAAAGSHPAAGREPPGRLPGRIVVTGFTAFPGVPDNPSAALVETLRSMPGLLPRETRYRLLEVGYAAVPPALEAIMEEPPAALVLTGYSALAEGLRLETRAHDHRSPDRADAFGFRPGAPGEPRNVREQLRADLPAIAHRVRQAGIPCTTSRDCGAYVCNHAYHQALRRITETGADTLAVFVHVPAIKGTPLAANSAAALPLAAMARGVALVARELVARELAGCELAGRG